jgi:hypothetical protein
MDFQSIALPSELRYRIVHRLVNNFLNKKPHFDRNGVFQKKGDDILSHKTAVPSAQAGLTTLFGMGRGEPRRNNHLKVVVT